MAEAGRGQPTRLFRAHAGPPLPVLPRQDHREHPGSRGRPLAIRAGQRLRHDLERRLQDGLGAVDRRILLHLPRRERRPQGLLEEGHAGRHFQLQETLALLHPGQAVSDLLEKDYVVVADYSGQTGGSSHVENPNAAPYGPFRWENTKPFTIQQYQFKSRNKPFIFFEPGNKMALRYESLASYGRASGCNHFPVGQARCDGRTTLTSDKPSHCSSFPISEPVMHAAGDREFWYALYGMTDWTVPQVVAFGRSWAYAPELVVSGPDVRSEGYDRSERCYQLVAAAGKPRGFEVRLKADASSPAVHPALRVRGWNGEKPRVMLNGKDYPDARVGLHRRLEGDILVIYLPVESKSPLTVRIVARLSGGRARAVHSRRRATGLRRRRFRRSGPPDGRFDLFDGQRLPAPQDAIAVGR